MSPVFASFTKNIWASVERWLGRKQPELCGVTVRLKFQRCLVRSWTSFLLSPGLIPHLKNDENNTGELTTRITWKTAYEILSTGPMIKAQPTTLLFHLAVVLILYRDLKNSSLSIQLIYPLGALLNNLYISPSFIQSFLYSVVHLLICTYVHLLICTYTKTLHPTADSYSMTS